MIKQQIIETLKPLKEKYIVEGYNIGVVKTLNKLVDDKLITRADADIEWLLISNEKN